MRIFDLGRLSRPFYGLLLLCATFAAPSAALERFLFEPNYLVDPAHTVKDHCLFLRDGVWHCFYIRGDVNQGGNSSEKDLGHAVSEDLRSWTLLPPALSVTPGDWDSRNVWAPMVIATPGQTNHWTMLYTGADDLVVQRMGRAYTNDLGLNGWAKMALNPIFEPDGAIYEWGAAQGFSAFRDPFYFYRGGRHHILNTAVLRDSTLAAGRRGAVHHISSADFVNWVEEDPLLVHNGPNNQAWHEIESVQLHHARGKWHFFFSELNVQGVHYLQSDAMDSGWDFASRVQLDWGTAPEITPAPSGDYLFSRHALSQHLFDGSNYWVIRVDSLRFDVDANPVIVRIDPLEEDWPIRSGPSFLACPTFGDNALERGETPVVPTGNGYGSSSEFFGGPLSSFGAPGATLGGGSTGSMQSRSFTISGNLLRFLVAKGGNPSVHLDLVRDSDSAVLYSESGEGSASFQMVEWDLTPYVGEDVHLEYVDDSAEADGFLHVDDIRELLAGTPAPGPYPGIRAVRLLPPRPNPFNPRTELRWSQTREGAIELAIFDLRGRRLRSMPRRTLAPGEHGWIWDGRDEAGHELASGRYLVRLNFDGVPSEAQALTLLR